MGRCGLDVSGWRKTPVAWCCEHGTEPSGSIKGGDFPYFESHVGLKYIFLSPCIISSRKSGWPRSAVVWQTLTVPQSWVRYCVDSRCHSNLVNGFSIPVNFLRLYRDVNIMHLSITTLMCLGGVEVNSRTVACLGSFRGGFKSPNEN